jgi:GNAT superfamily N-acetyltransferase
VTNGVASPVDRAIRAVAAFGLSRGSGPDSISIDEEEGVAFERRLLMEKLTGFAIAAHDDGALALSDERFASVLERHRRAMASCLMIEDRLLQLDEHFRRAGIGYAVLKGPAVAHRAYPDPSLRGFGDLDVLVRGEAFPEACTVLGTMGFRRRLAEPRPGFDERFGKAAAHVHVDDSMEIDLHRTLALGPFGLWIDPGALLDRATTFELAGRRIPRLDDTDMLISVAMHAVLGWPPRLLPYRDVVQVARSPDVDWPTLARHAGDWHLTAVMIRAFESASFTLGTEPVGGSTILESVPIRRSETRALASYDRRHRALGGTALSTLRAIPGVRNKAAYVRAVAFPQRAFMRDRYPTGTNRTYRHRLAIPAKWALRRVSRT